MFLYIKKGVSDVQRFQGVSPVLHTMEGQRWDVASQFLRQNRNQKRNQKDLPKE